MFYTIYKITNKINNKIYIGAHKTTNLDDGYMGSGTILKIAQSKYGIENFEKEILEVFDTSEEMFEMESKLVTKDFIEETNNYNLKEGGEGGFDYLNSVYEEMSIRGKNGRIAADKNGAHEKAMKRLKWLRENDSVWLDKKNKNHSDSMKKRYEMGMKNNFLGKTHTEETKQKMSNIMKELHKGENNPSFGSIWIHSLTEKVSKKIKKEALSYWETKGWLKGRKMKFL